MPDEWKSFTCLNICLADIWPNSPVPWYCVERRVVILETTNRNIYFLNELQLIHFFNFKIAVHFLLSYFTHPRFGYNVHNFDRSSTEYHFPFLPFGLYIIHLPTHTRYYTDFHYIPNIYILHNNQACPQNTNHNRTCIHVFMLSDAGHLPLYGRNVAHISLAISRSPGTGVFFSGILAVSRWCGDRIAFITYYSIDILCLKTHALWLFVYFWY